MHKGWGMWVCGVVLGAAAGFVCGHVAAWTRAESRLHESEVVAHSGLKPSSPPALAESHEGPVYFPDRLAESASRGDSAMVHADALVEAGAEHPAAGEPAELPATSDAAPLPDKDQQTLRAILETELADLSPADREVWLDALAGMPPADAVGVVRLWKKFGGRPGPLAEALPPDALAPSILSPNPLAPAPLSIGDAGARGPSAQRMLRTNLHAARDLVLRNLLSAETYGFRRTEPLFAIPCPAPAPPESALPGDGELIGTPTLQMVGTRIDQSCGQITETSSPLDLAIEGDGYFVVTDPDGRELFTRCGRFSRADDGRLVLHTSLGELALSPAIVIPEDSAALTVSPEGEVAATQDGGAGIGTLLLAVFVAPAQLERRCDALFSATGGSGAAQLGRADDGLRGGIMQRRLERSNVNVLAERRLLQQIDEWLELIDTAAP